MKKSKQEIIKILRNVSNKKIASATALLPKTTTGYLGPLQSFWTLNKIIEKLFWALEMVTIV